MTIRIEPWPGAFRSSRGDWSNADAAFMTNERVQQVAQRHALEASTHRRPVEVDSADVIEANRINDQARALAATSSQFAVALSANLSGLPVVALDDAGVEPVSEPMRDIASLTAWWAEHDSPAGMAVGSDHDVLAVAFDDDGWQRMVELASPVPPSRGSGYFSSSLPHMLDHLGAPVSLVERRPGGVPRFRASYAFGQSDADIERAWSWAKESDLQTRRIALAWRWPTGDWRFKIGSRVARGTNILPAVLLDGAIVRRGGKVWVAQVPPPHRWSPAPDWLCADVLGGKVRVPA